MIFEHIITRTPTGWYIDYRFDYGTGPDTENRLFSTYLDAKRYVESSFIATILIRYESWLKKTEPYLNTQNKDIYDTALRSVQYFFNHNIETLKKYLLKFSPDLQRLVPSRTQARDMTTLKRELEEIIMCVKNFDIDNQKN